MTDLAREAAIAARLKAATPGPWEASVSQDEDGHDIRMADAIVSPGNHFSAHFIEYDHGMYRGERGWKEANANADFIAHAPADVAYLLDALREARAETTAALRAMNQMVVTPLPPGESNPA